MIPLAVIYRLDADESGYSPVGTLDDAYSVVWTERWQDYGEAQIRAPASCPAQVGDIITVVGRSMAAEVVGRTETQAGAELRCKDALSVLDRRIVYPMVKNDGSVSTFVGKLLANDDIVGDGSQPSWNDRALRPLRVGDLSAITASAVLQRSYGQLGETILELGRTYGFDPVASLSGKHIAISARSSATSREWMLGGGLAGYVEDTDVSNAKNVAYVAGQTYDGARVTERIGSGEGMARRETSVDRRDVQTKEMSWEGAELLYGPIHWQDPNYDPEDPTYFNEDYSGTLSFTVEGIGDITEPRFEVRMRAGDGSGIEGGFVLDADWFWTTDQGTAIFSQIEERYSRAPWQSFEIMGPGIAYGTDGARWEIPTQRWEHPEHPPTDDPITVWDSDVSLYAQIYVDAYGVLRPIGEEALANATPTQAFGASVEGMKPYEDYNLGDIVRIIKRPGDWRAMRVAEIVESWDSQGYRATPNLANI